MIFDSQYTYLMTDHDLVRIERLICLVVDAIGELFEKRQIVPVDGLDTDPDHFEMRLRELAATIADRQPSASDGL